MSCFLHAPELLSSVCVLLAGVHIKSYHNRATRLIKVQMTKMAMSCSICLIATVFILDTVPPTNGAAEVHQFKHQAEYDGQVSATNVIKQVEFNFHLTLFE